MDNRIYYLLSRAENTMSVYIKQQFVKAGLKVTPPQLGVLFMLKAKEIQTMSALSQMLGTDNSAVTRIIDRLEKSGLVERRSSANDRREYQVIITGEGIAETEKSKKVIAAINKVLEQEFSVKELDDLRSILSRMDRLFRQ